MMLRRSHIILAFLFAGTSAFISCGHSLKPDSYLKWMENPDNGLRKSKNMGPVEYTIQYKTPEYISVKKHSDAKVDKEGHSGIHYFGLTLNPIDKKSQLLYVNLADQQDYFDRVQYYNFYFKNDIFLQVKGKQLPCEYYFFESNGKITPELTFTLGFDAGEQNGDLQLVINDRVFGTGGINFLFKEKTLNNIPKLKTQS